MPRARSKQTGRRQRLVLPMCSAVVFKKPPPDHYPSGLMPLIFVRSGVKAFLINLPRGIGISSPVGFTVTPPYGELMLSATANARAGQFTSFTDAGNAPLVQASSARTVGSRTNGLCGSGPSCAETRVAARRASAGNARHSTAHPAKRSSYGNRPAVPDKVQRKMRIDAIDAGAVPHEGQAIATSMVTLPTQSMTCPMVANRKRRSVMRHSAARSARGFGKKPRRRIRWRRASLRVFTG